MQSISRIRERTLSTNASTAIVLSLRSYYSPRLGGRRTCRGRRLARSQRVPIDCAYFFSPALECSFIGKGAESSVSQAFSNNPQTPSVNKAVERPPVLIGPAKYRRRT